MSEKPMHMLSKFGCESDVGHGSPIIAGNLESEGQEFGGTEVEK